MAGLRAGLAVALALSATVHGLRLPAEDKSTVSASSLDLADPGSAGSTNTASSQETTVQDESIVPAGLNLLHQDISSSANITSSQEEGSVQEKSAVTADMTADQEKSAITAEVSSADQETSQITTNYESNATVSVNSAQNTSFQQDPSNVTESATKASVPKHGSLNGPVEWTYFPPEPHVAIVTGGLPEEYEPGNFGDRSAEILLKYARRKGYALYVERDITVYTDRKPSWGKLPLMSKLLVDAPDVPLFVWMDSDVVPSTVHFSMDLLVRQAACNGNRQSRWVKYFPAEVQDDTFLWLGAQQRDRSKDQNLVNSAPGMMALRNVPTAREFLTKVWKTGDLPTMRNSKKKDALQVNAWEAERGAIWDVLAANPKHFMTRTCLAPFGKLFSLTTPNKRPATSVALHRLYNMSLGEKNEFVDKYWNDMGFNETSTGMP